jgi:antitoxin (DNA-binding transcriptional repressor) of toxin-antitoxin stability system
MTYTLEEAQAHLAELLTEAEQGHEVVIERSDKPNLRIVVSPAPEKDQGELKPRVPGQYAGQFFYPNELWDPLETDEQLREYGFDIMIDDGKPVDWAS